MLNVHHMKMMMHVFQRSLEGLRSLKMAAVLYYHLLKISTCFCLSMVSAGSDKIQSDLARSALISLEHAKVLLLKSLKSFFPPKATLLAASGGLHRQHKAEGEEHLG